MKTVVITGSTRGIGYGLAQSLLARGCQVMVSGRRQQSVDDAVAKLGAQFTRERVCGKVCDITNYRQVQSLWEAATARFGKVDIWLNNAAGNSIEQDFWEHENDVIETLIQTNIIGTMYGCKVAIRGMLQQGYGHVYTFRGWGSGGEMRPGSSLYGTSKAATAYFTKTLVRELKTTPVKLSSISPGMVMTDLLVQSFRPEREAQIRTFVNILGDNVETVTPWLAKRILANNKHGAQINWLKPHQIVGRLLIAPFRQRDVVGPALSREAQ